MCKSWNAQTSVLCRHCWDAQWCVSITLDKCTLEGGYIGRMYIALVPLLLKLCQADRNQLRRGDISAQIYIDAYCWCSLHEEYALQCIVLCKMWCQHSRVIELCPILVNIFLCLMFTIATIVSHNLWLYLHSGQQFEETFENKKEHFNKLGHILLVALTGAL